MRADLFPGQGSQYVGMGSDFYEKFDSVKKNFEIAESECKFLLEKKLPLPAYDQCLKASHIFNLLDSRS